MHSMDLCELSSNLFNNLSFRKQVHRVQLVQDDHGMRRLVPSRLPPAKSLATELAMHLVYVKRSTESALHLMIDKNIFPDDQQPGRMVGLTVLVAWFRSRDC